MVSLRNKKTFETGLLLAMFVKGI